MPAPHKIPVCSYATINRPLQLSPFHVSPNPMNVRVALYQPDIPGNTGTILRMAACLGFTLDLIEPAGFDISDRALKRAGMDYMQQAALMRHSSWIDFQNWRQQNGRRIVLLSTKAAIPYTDYQFRDNDILLFGRESSGVPDDVHAIADARLLIPIVPPARSLNLAVSVAMTMGEALRQTGRFNQPSANGAL